KALAIGKAHALRSTGANAAWGRTYSLAFSVWMKENGFASLPKSARSCAIEMAENSAEVTRWRDSLPERQRRRLNDPHAVLTRWRKETTDPGGRTVGLWERDARSAFKRLCTCVAHLPPDRAAALWATVRERACA